AQVCLNLLKYFLLICCKIFFFLAQCLPKQKRKGCEDEKWGCQRRIVFILKRKRNWSGPRTGPKCCASAEAFPPQHPIHSKKKNQRPGVSRPNATATGGIHLLRQTIHTRALKRPDRPLQWPPVRRRNHRAAEMTHASTVFVWPSIRQPPSPAVVSRGHRNASKPRVASPACVIGVT
ncbi:hypothetical protein V8G54_011146, partial [Vigna mungo]